MSAEDPKDVARLREAFASLADEGGGSSLEPERLFDALHGDVSPEERQAVVDQLLTDPAAAEAWRLAREMEPDVAVSQAPDNALTAAPRPPAWRWMSAAAAAVLAVGVGWFVTQSRVAEEPAYRSVESRTIVSALPDNAPLSRAQPILRWSGVEGARYRVRVLTPELQLLEESPETPASEYTLTADALTRIPPAGRVLWQVEARLPGEGIITSPTFSNPVP